MIYVPDYQSGNCAYLSSSNILRVYVSRPQQGGTYSYREYAVDNHYLYRDGTSTFGNYSTLPTCLSDGDVTTNYFYRTDIDSILIIFTIFIGINYFLISKLVKLFFRGSKVF